MREIKFRAKKITIPAWVYGDVRHHKDDVCIFKKGGNTGEQVKPDTIGQYTGLKDKNGMEIYEGDVVECVSWNEYFSDLTNGVMQQFRRQMVVCFLNGGFKMVEKMPEPMQDNVWDIICNGDIEVIGNIHDNPELLEKE